MKTSVIAVPDLLSELTVDEVEERIVKVPGVEGATVNFAAGSVTVRYDETQLEVADIKSAVRQRGHAAPPSAATADTPPTAAVDNRGGSTALSAQSPTPAPEGSPGQGQMNTTSFVIPFNSPDATLPNVGGKGANLSLMTRASFPVPSGFLLTTNAYRAFVQINNLQKQIVDLASNKMDTGEKRSVAIRQLFASGKIPAGVAGAISHAYANLAQEAGELPLAVRSSATAEDLPGASFAGQQDSYLNVRGESALLEAMQRCWSSLWTARALEYRARQGIEPSAVSLAVVVQVMVPAEASGIMFTANPLTGARDEIAIDAAWGLGEAIVGGLVTPDHIVAEKTTGAIKQVTVADKTVMTQPTAEGTEEQPVEESKRRAQVLTATQVTELATLGAEIDKYYSEPQDIEWCLAKGKFYIVQARPITALPPEPVKWDNPVTGSKWLKDIRAAEWATEPLSPLGATTTFVSMIEAREREFPNAKSPWFTLVNGWLYIRADFRLVRMMVFFLPWMARLVAGRTDGYKRVRRRWPRQLTLLDSLENTKLAKLADDALQAHANRLLEALGRWWWEVSWAAGVMSHAEIFIKMLRVPELANPAVLFRGNDGLLLEGERTLRRAASTGETREYLEKFGHFVESADPIHLTLRESPDLLAQHLAAARQSKFTPDERLARTRPERETAENLVRAVRGLRGFLARRWLKAGQSHAAQVDNAVFHFQRVLALVRATFLEAGRRLVLAGHLEQADDVFYLERDEVWAGVDSFKTTVMTRRTLRDQQKRLVPPPSIPPLADPIWGRDRMMKMTTSAGVQERNAKRVLVGMPGSPGRAEGPARVIAGPDDFHRLQPGDVLVANTTTPVWTPLFNIASAVVTEVGGPFSHAAIVAREFGIPLVTGAIGATRVIADGAKIVVDGTAGIVAL
jgi:pyruvate,water dikinase